MQTTETHNGLIHAFMLDGKGGGRPLDWTAVREWKPEQGSVWVHLDYTSDLSRDWLLQESGFNELIAEALVAEETRPRCSVIDDGLLVSLRGVNSNPGADPEDMVSARLYCTQSMIISTRRRRLLSIRDLVEMLEHGKGPRTTDELVEMLADRMTDRMSEVINALEDRIDELEESMIDTSEQTMRRNILELRREIIKLRRYLAPQRDALKSLYAADVSWLSEHARMGLREVYDKITRYVEDLDSAKDRAAVANEELAGRLAEQMNTRMYVLSLIAGLFLPLGFVTGLLGINVGGIPLAENPFGFAAIIVLLVLLLILEILIFRHKKWF